MLPELSLDGGALRWHQLREIDTQNSKLFTLHWMLLLYIFAHVVAFVVSVTDYRFSLLVPNACLFVPYHRLSHVVHCFWTVPCFFAHISVSLLVCCFLLFVHFFCLCGSLLYTNITPSTKYVCTSQHPQWALSSCITLIHQVEPLLHTPTMTVLLLPPSESCSKRVSFEFLYGIWLLFPSTSADMTLPSVERDKLILVASFSRWPVAPVLDCLSEPCQRRTKQDYFFIGEFQLLVHRILPEDVALGVLTVYCFWFIGFTGIVYHLSVKLVNL